jgi:hemerythrin-like domain-containing protein
MENRPIKRSEQLKALSRDHHFGLLFCWKIKQGLQAAVEPERLGRYVDYFWSGHLKEHFLIEESLLFDRCQDPVCTQAKKEHGAILDQIGKIAGGERDNPEAYAVLVSILNKHIRYEERVVFPHLEQALPVSLLDEIAQHLDSAHKDDFEDNYSDEFWMEPKKQSNL